MDRERLESYQQDESKESSWPDPFGSEAVAQIAEADGIGGIGYDSQPFPAELTSVGFTFLAALLRWVGQIVIREELVKEEVSRNQSPFDRSMDGLSVICIERSMLGSTERRASREFPYDWPILYRQRSPFVEPPTPINV